MANNKFSIEEALRFGWNKMKGDFLYFAGLFLIVIVFNALISALVSSAFGEEGGVALLVTNLLSWIVNIFITIGMLKIFTNYARGHKESYKELYSNSHLFWRYLAGSLLYALIVLGGLILLIVPGIIWAVKYQFYQYLIVDKGMGPVEAIKASGRLTDGQKLNVLVFNIVGSLVAVLGFLAFFVGMFASLPTVALASAWVYLELSKNQNIGSETVTPLPKSA